MSSIRDVSGACCQLYKRRDDNSCFTYSPVLHRQVIRAGVVLSDSIVTDDITVKGMRLSINDSEKLLDDSMLVAQFIVSTGETVHLSERVKPLFSDVLEALDPSLATAVHTIIDMQSFKPDNVEVLSPNVRPRQAPGANYTFPPYSPQVLQVLLAAEALYPEFSQSFLTGLGHNAGLPVSVVSGLERRGYVKSLNKMSDNIVCPRSEYSSDLMFAADLDIMRFWPFQDQIELDLSDERVFSFFKGKKTSLGYLPVKFFFMDKGRRVPVNRVKKDKGAHAVIHFKNLYLDSIRKFEQGGPEPLNIFIEVEAVKHELVRWTEALSLDNSEDNLEFVEKCLTKLRLFYMSGGLRYGLDKAIYEPISRAYRYYQCAIGIRPEAGGFQIIWDMMNGGKTAPFKDKRQEIVEKWAHKYDLTDFQVGQGDYSSYDQTLLAAVLAYCMAIVFYIYKPSKDLPPFVLRYILVDFVTSMVHKVMYVYGLDKFISVWGAMFSGKYPTSSGDSRNQAFIFSVYYRRLLSLYPDDQEFLLDCYLYYLIFVVFFGDDHLFRWPTVLNDFKMYPDSENFLIDFVNFCCREFGMKYKKAVHAVFDNILYSERHFFTNDKGMVLEDHSLGVEGPEFLQNQVANIYLDNEYVGVAPYRSTDSLFARLGYSLSATSTLKGAMMLWSSLARLSAGNLEAFSALSLLYKLAARTVGDIQEEDWRDFLQTRHSFAVYLSTRGKTPADMGTFPTWKEVYMLQEEGFRSGEGFMPQDPKGRPNKTAKSRLYSRVEDIKVFQNTFTAETVEVDFSITPQDLSF